ncbi:MAG: Spo0E family sporulation regulatory protein-aspartic acid phosphatase [Sulfobacillus sp.]
MCMVPLLSYADYTKSIDQIRLLQLRLHELASSKGNLHPDVIALSQELDDYVVIVQKYWRHICRESLTG